MTKPRLLGGRYEVGDTLGYGGMAEVHHGRDVRLGREVAIKVLRADLARDPSFQARFKREAQAAASLNHPSIVSVYDTGEDLGGSTGFGANGHTPYIVMEFVDGQTLRDVLKNEGRLHPQRAMEIAADICAALDFSHRAGIVHRDIKPGNVMVTRSGAIKVMDFGIARAVADNAATVTATAAVIGTAQYLSPEQARGEPVDARSDVYSMGCLLYELLTGHPPFTGDSPVAVAYQHVRETATPPSATNRDVSPELDAIVMKALAKNPINRYQSAGEMRTDLVRAMAGRPVQAEPVMSDAERTTVLGGPATTGTTALASTGLYQPLDQPTRSRRGWAFALLALAVIAVFVIGALITIHLLNSPAPPSTIAVPTLQGKTEAAAKSALTDAGLNPGTTQYQVTNTQSAWGIVLSSDPQQGSTVQKGSTVTLVVGRKPDTVPVPDVQQYSSYDAAAAALTNLGLQAVEQDVSNAKPQGTVLGSSPQAGTQVAKNSVVKVLVSNGTGNATIPSGLVGTTQAEATSLLRQAGFTNIVVQQGTPQQGSFAAGTVYQVDPVSGTQTSVDSTVTLFVAATPEPSGSPSPSPSSPTALPTTSSLPPSSSTGDTTSG